MRKIPAGYEDATWRDVGVILQMITREAARIPGLWLRLQWERLVDRLREGLKGEGARRW